MHFTGPASNSRIRSWNETQTRAASGAKTLSKYIVACSFLFAVSVTHAAKMVSVDGAKLNMRTGPGTQYSIDWEVSHGYPMAVIDRKGSWLKVRDFENDEGWVYRSLTGNTPYHVVKSNIANIRSAPGTNSRIVGKARYGDVLRTLNKRGEWVKIANENGLKGWVARRLLWGW